MTKKQLLWLLLFLLLLILIIILKYCNYPKKVDLNAYRKNQFIVSYKTFDRPLSDSLRKIYTLLDTCACSQQIELYEALSADLIPETGDIRGGGTGSSGNAWVMKNYIVQDSAKLDTFDRRIRIGQEENNTSFFNGYVRNKYPQPTDESKQVIIAIIDSGVDENGMMQYDKDASNNPAPTRLYRNLVNTKFCGTTTLEGNYGMNILKVTGNEPDSDPKDVDGHGTFINGIIAGLAAPAGNHVGDNQGVQFKLLNIKFAKNRTEPGALFDALCGVHYALNKGATVINASWRSLTINQTEENNIKAFFEPTLRALQAKQALLITGSGNDHLNLDLSEKAWPACFSKDIEFKDNVITVGAWDIDTTKIAFFSNFGSYVDIYAPGNNIISTGLDESRNFSIMRGRGTSYATPFVVRAAAILRGMLPANTTAREIKERIIETTLIPNQNQAVKLLNHSNAIQNIRRPVPPSS